MTERQEQLAQLEQAVLDATLQSPDCNRDQLAHALMAMDPELLETQACCSRSHACKHCCDIIGQDVRMLASQSFLLAIRR